MTACERIRLARAERERLEDVWGDMLADAVEAIAEALSAAPAASYEHGGVIVGGVYQERTSE